MQVVSIESKSFSSLVLFSFVGNRDFEPSFY